uniref:NmrA-like domain-containing protein n=1 Tax=Dasya naccarioides TaxID=2007180 RepID=A0A1Z1MH64_9FLOR|nr:hypothetical protein [Dasya naccarioides]ARW65165.1 hypothetical protein [Dasya naccarioides]
MSLLIIGSTGTLGRQIVRRALNQGFQVKCLVRNFRKAAFLKEWGAELIYGDLSIAETIPMSLYGISAIIDASTTRSYDLFNARKIDLIGKYILLESAKKAKIKHYIFFSILDANKYSDIPLINLKLLIQNRLIKSDLCYTIFNISGFFQGLITQYAVPILDQKTIWLTEESQSISYIGTEDIAKIAVKSLSIVKSKHKNFLLGGHRGWTSLEVINLCEKICGKKAKISKISIKMLIFLKDITNLFQWSWDISARLSFISLLSTMDDYSKSFNETLKVFNLQKNEIEFLEVYLQEYFQKIMSKLKQLNYKVLNDEKNNNDLKF